MVDVLIAEDVDLQATLLERFLRSDHEVVGIAQTGRQAVELTGLSDPDVVTMDLDMPSKNGIQATAEIRQSNPDICIIVSTALVDSEAREKVIEAGADEILTKPFSHEELLTAIKEHIN